MSLNISQYPKISGASALDLVPIWQTASGVQRAVQFQNLVPAVIGNLITSDSPQSSNFTVGQGDKGKCFQVTTGASTITATLPLATSLADGFYFLIRKVDAGAGSVISSPVLSPISVSLTSQGQGALIWSDGVNFFVFYFSTAASGGGGGTPGGANTQVQYNNSGAFGGIAGATTDGTITTFAAGDLNLTDALITNEVSPSTPAAGKTRAYVDSTSKNIAAKNDAGTVNHGIQTRSATASNWIRSIADDGSSTISQPAFSDLSGSATAAQMPAFTGDVTTSAGSTVTTNVNLPDGVTQAGSLVVTDIAAPSAPAAAHLKIYGDSTDLRFHDINAAGTIATTVVKDTGAANNFLTAISASGVISKAQPSFANLSGTATYTQLPTIAPITQNDEAIFTIPDTGRLLQPNRLTLSGTERGTLSGVGRTLISDVLNNKPDKGAFNTGSFNIMDLEYDLQFQQLTLAGNARLTETGTGRQVIADLVTGTGGGGGGGNVSNSGVPTVGQLATWLNATTIQGVTTLPAANFPALTGDVTTTAGSLVTTFTKTIPPITQNDETTFTVPDTGRLLQPNRLTLSGTERATEAGIGRTLISDVLNYEPSKGVTPTGSFNVMDTEYALQLKRLSLAGNSRLTETGTGREVLVDLIPPASGAGAGSVTNTSGNLTLNSAIVGNGGSDVKASSVTIDSSGNISTGTGNGVGLNLPSTNAITSQGGHIDFLIANASRVAFTTSGRVNIANGWAFSWDSTLDPASNTPDTALNRNAAGIVEINNGTAGQFADLKARNIFLTGTGPAPITQNDYTTGFTVPTNGLLQQPNRATLSGTERATIAGTGRDAISDQSPTNTPLHKVTLNPTSFILRAGEYITQYLRLALAGNTRATLTENARIVNFEFRPPSHLVLAGAGL